MNKILDFLQLQKQTTIDYLAEVIQNVQYHSSRLQSPRPACPQSGTAEGDLPHASPVAAGTCSQSLVSPGL